jgi:hypothetical protein
MTFIMHIIFIQLKPANMIRSIGKLLKSDQLRDDEVIPGDDDHELDMDELSYLEASLAKTSTEIKEPTNIT